MTLARLLSPSFIIFAFKKKEIDQEFIGDLAISGSGKFVKIFDLEKSIVTSILRRRKNKHIIPDMIKAQQSFGETAPQILSYDESRGYVLEDLLSPPIHGVYFVDENVKSIVLHKVFEKLFTFYHSQIIDLIQVRRYLNHISEELEIYEENGIIKDQVHEVQSLLTKKFS